MAERFVPFFWFLDPAFWIFVIICGAAYWIWDRFF
jgi:hypothetical protein